MDVMKKPINPMVSAIFRQLGRNGGLARMAKLSKEERSELGRQAIAKRWAGHTKKASIKETPAT